MSNIIQFQLGVGTDHKGRTINDIWELSDFWLEHDHQYIQWLFPIDTHTKFNKHAPTLMDGDIATFKNNKLLKKSQQRSLEVMVNFFGMVIEGENILHSENLNIRDHIWLKHGGHNHLRITRIIRSLALCGNLSLSMKFQSAMINTAEIHGEVSNKTIDFWKKANLLK